jgi:hypothetical protein
MRAFQKPYRQYWLANAASVARAKYVERIAGSSQTVPPD